MLQKLTDTCASQKIHTVICSEIVIRFKLKIPEEICPGTASGTHHKNLSEIPPDIQPGNLSVISTEFIQRLFPDFLQISLHVFPETSSAFPLTITLGICPRIILLVVSVKFPRRFYSNPFLILREIFQ